MKPTPTPQGESAPKPYDHMEKYTTLEALHEAKRTRTHIITLWDVLKRAYQLGEEAARVPSGSGANPIDMLSAEQGENTPIVRKGGKTRVLREVGSGAMPGDEGEVRQTLHRCIAAINNYRHQHDTKGRGALETGQAWDEMRKASKAGLLALSQPRQAAQGMPAGNVKDVLQRALPYVGNACEPRAYDEDAKILYGEMEALISHPAAQPGADAVVWPRITPPAMHENPAGGWDDPELPDFTKMNAVAREFGYSIALHGSMKRDVDLVAIPWIDEAADPDVLVSHLCGAIDAKRVSQWEQKPNGRLAINLQINGWFKMIDLSVMPRTSRAGSGEVAALNELQFHLVRWFNLHPETKVDVALIDWMSKKADPLSRMMLVWLSKYVAIAALTPNKEPGKVLEEA